MNPAHKGGGIENLSSSDLENLDPIRKLVVESASLRGMSLAMLSRKAGRNPAYFHQFITRSSPKILSEDVRDKVAPLLGLEPSDLDPKRSKKLPSSQPKHNQPSVFLSHGAGNPAAAGTASSPLNQLHDMLTAAQAGTFPDRDADDDAVMVILVRRRHLRSQHGSTPVILDAMEATAAPAIADARLVAGLMAALATQR